MHATSFVATAAGAVMAIIYLLWQFDAEQLVAGIVRRITQCVSLGRLRLPTASDADEMICIGTLMACVIIFAAAMYWGG